jgi:hypothetical protein
MTHGHGNKEQVNCHYMNDKHPAHTIIITLLPQSVGAFIRFGVSNEHDRSWRTKPLPQLVLL